MTFPWLPHSPKLRNPPNDEIWRFGLFHLSESEGRPGHRPSRLSGRVNATEQIRLTSSMTVLSSADPVKVFEDYVA